MKKLCVFILCSLLDKNLNIDQDNYYTHTHTKERLLDSRESFFSLKIFLIKEFVLFLLHISMCRLVTNAGLEFRRCSMWLVGDGASQVGIFDGTTEGSSKKFSSIKEVEEKENCGVSSSAPLWLRLAGLRSAINQD